MKYLPATIAALCLMATSCTPGKQEPVKNDLHAMVISTTDLSDVPSGSALEKVGEQLYLISDDARNFYQMEGGLIRDSVRINHLAKGERRIAKPLKPDYEAAISASVMGQPCVVAFGSGSLRPQRESGLIISIKDPAFQKVVPLGQLYAAMREEAGIPESDFNIEAAALHSNRLLLINRGSNHVFSLDWEKTLNHLLSGAELPEITASAVSLTKTDKYPTGISGAYFIDANRVIFCASAEATTDWVSDGEVLGSFIGILNIDDEGAAQLAGFAPVLYEGKPIEDKIEGISAASGPENGELALLCIVDNDDGTSRLLHVMVDHIP